MISKYEAASYNKCSFLDEHVYLCLLCYKWLYFSISQKWLIAADVERIRELLWCVICCCWIIFLIQTVNVVRKVWTKNKIKWKKKCTQKVKPTSVNYVYIYNASDRNTYLYTFILMLSTIIKKSKCLVSKRLIAHIFHSATFRQLYWLFNTFYKLRKDILVVLVFHQHG